MRSLVLGVAALGMVASWAGTAAAKNCDDDAAVAAARAAAEEQCGCDSASNHGQFVSCAVAVAKTRASLGLLPRHCQSEVVSCSARSTCGRPGAVTCCSVGGGAESVQCDIAPSAEECEARSGVTCVGSSTSCCDACEGSGSADGSFVCGGSTTTTAAPPTTTPVPTTSTSPPSTGVPTTTPPTTTPPTTSVPPTTTPPTTSVPPTTGVPPTTTPTTTTTSTTLLGSPGSAFLDAA